MKWNKKYTLGIAAIDAQHKQLFRLSDDLDSALQAGIRTEDLDSLLLQLKQYAARHFTLEERQMADLNYAGLVEQQETHKKFVHRFSELHQQLATDGLSAELINLLQQELSGWIRDHVTGMDQEFGSFYKSRG
ncbi:MAG TPA: bacteriohemerythrin [Desulfobulbaceae bacterium]|nr:bacteriohemerythrin [Desulfobulbaceae bacterium]